MRVTRVEDERRFFVRIAREGKREAVILKGKIAKSQEKKPIELTVKAIEFRENQNSLRDS